MAVSHHVLLQGGLLPLPAKLRTSREPQNSHWMPAHKPQRSSSAVAVIAKLTSTGTATGESRAPTGTMTVYRDNWFDRLAIRHLTRSVQAASGFKREEKVEGYDGLVEAASMVARNFDVKSQQELVIQSLDKAFPSPILKMIRTILPPSKTARKFFAVFTTYFFPWLIGPCEVRGADFNGTIEKNVVFIYKCRFLETTNCVGMCTNLCKVPTQKFIQDSLGMPLNMVPNFEDMSCQMIFGESPPADDPALKQPCYNSICKAKQIHGVNCSS